MTYRQLEEFINKSTVELEEQEKLLLNQATQVNAWDGQLIKNGHKVCAGTGGCSGCQLITVLCDVCVW